MSTRWRKRVLRARNGARMLAWLAAVLLAGTAAAQDMYMDAFNNAGSLISDIAGNAAVGKSIRNQAEGRGGNAGVSPRTSTAPPADIGTLLSFRRDPGITEQVRLSMAEALRRDNPAAAEEFLRTSRQFDVREAFAQEGLSPGSLVDVATYTVGVYWAAAHGATTPPRGKPLRALRKQMAGALLKDAPERLRNVSDARKQQAADDMLLRAHMVSRMLQGFARRPDPKAQSALAEAARAHIRKTLGLDLAAFQLTDEGLVR